MLIFNEEQRLRAGITSLSKRCSYCCKALAAYPLLISDDARFAVYHPACAAAIATEILVDLCTFFHPPAPYQQTCVLEETRKVPLTVKEDPCNQPILKKSRRPSSSRPFLPVPG